MRKALHNKIYKYMVWKWGLSSDAEDSYQEDLDKIMTDNSKQLESIQNDLENSENGISNLKMDLDKGLSANEKALQEGLKQERSANEKALEEIGNDSSKKRSEISERISKGQKAAADNVNLIIDNFPDVWKYSLDKKQGACVTYHVSDTNPSGHTYDVPDFYECTATAFTKNSVLTQAIGFMGNVHTSAINIFFPTKLKCCPPAALVEEKQDLDTDKIKEDLVVVEEEEQE